MEEYRTEEEQVEALRRWWNENGRSTVAAVIVALAAGFGWQGWQSHQQAQREQASDAYQALLQALGQPGSPQQSPGVELAEQLKAEYSSSTYAQFAALHLAALAVNQGDLAEAEAQLRWVLGKASRGSDTALVAQLRLARVVAAKGETEQALSILAQDSGSFHASYAAARGDILLAAGRDEEARDAYNQALSQGGMGVNLPALQQKLQSLNPVPARELVVAAEQSPEPAVEPAPEEEPGDAGEG